MPFPEDPRTPEGRAEREGKWCSRGHLIKYRETTMLLPCGCYADNPEGREAEGLPPRCNGRRDFKRSLRQIR